MDPHIHIRRPVTAEDDRIQQLSDLQLLPTQTLGHKGLPENMISGTAVNPDIRERNTLLITGRKAA